ncbi:ABC transporter substrate-binding protein [Castellaniella sp.]|uniref:ABC transporter substrate-binding protein n=1 Tax=Castellaniella sp. TaxID=1955812 RepID=UPI00356044E5
MKHFALKAAAAALAVPLSFGLGLGSAQANEPLRIGVTTFLSGPGAVFGVPAKDAADLLVEEINKKGGIKGAPVELIYLDEAKGIDDVVAQYKQLATAGKVDLMIAGLSSSTCLALAPVIEDFEMPAILWDCGTHRIFEENDFDYIYRTGDFTPPNNVSIALYTLKHNPDIKTIAGINPDYAFGRDNWESFKTAMEALDPDIEVVAELFPKLGSSDYSSEISRLSALRPDIVFSTLWGGDMNTFIKQAASRSLFNNSTLVSSNGESALQELGDAFPEGAIIGARGDSWFLGPRTANNPEHTKFVEDFKAKTGHYPIFPAYHMAQSVTALEQALDKGWDGTPENLKKGFLAGMDGLVLDNFTGQLAIRPDHQAIEDQIIGVTVKSPDYSFPILEQMTYIPAELITPPVGTTTAEWAKTLSPKLLDEVTIAK